MRRPWVPDRLRAVPRAARTSNVASITTIVLSLSLGGAAVASHLVVRTSDIADNAVNGSKVANGSMTGKDVKERSLAKVPKAAKVDGASLKRFRKVTGVAGQTFLASLGGLRLTYECEQSGISPIPKIRARSRIDDASVFFGSIKGPEGGGEAFWSAIHDLDRGEAEPLADSGAASIRLHYRAPGGSKVSGALDFTATSSSCIVQGMLAGA